MVEPTDGVHIGDWNEIFKSAALSGTQGLCVSKLTEDVKGLVKKKIAMRHGERNGG